MTLHSLAHPGIKATVKLITDRYVWKSIKSDCTKWAQSCLQYQRAKVSRHNKAQTGNFIPSNEEVRAYSHRHRGTITDVKRIQVLPDNNRSILSLVGGNSDKKHNRRNRSTEAVPTRITTDQGRQFEAELFQQLMQLTGTTHLRTTVYHPEANGLVEKLHRQIKAAIRCHETEAWITVLPIIMMSRLEGRS